MTPPSSINSYTENRMYKLKAAEWRPQHFKWEVKDRVGTITLNRPERKNPLTLESYAELRDTFHKLQYAEDVRAVVFTGEGGNFCSGGDVHEIIGPLTKMDMTGLIAFTRMTGNLVKEMRTCPQPIIAAVDGICAGAGAIISMASDLRYGTPECKTAFLFVRVGLAGCDMGACAILPRIIGQGRAAELFYTGRAMSAQEGAAWGYYNDIVPKDKLLERAHTMAKEIADGPYFAHSMTKKCLHQEWNQTIEQALETEAEAQAICMQTKDFTRAYNAFVAKQKPAFEGN
jgi:enoyl-CoA hydratase/carnithine racemase